MVCGLPPPFLFGQREIGVFRLLTAILRRDSPRTVPPLLRRLATLPREHRRLVESDQLLHELVVGEIGGQTRDPVVDQSQPAVVDDLRTDVRHPSGTHRRHPVEQGGAEGIAGRDHPRVRNAKPALRWLHAHRPHVAEREVDVEMEVRHAAAAEAMARRAVDVEIGTGTGLERLGCVAGIGQPRQAHRRPGPGHCRKGIFVDVRLDDHVLDQPGVTERLQLVHANAIHDDVAVELGHREGECGLGPGVVAPQALVAAEEPPRLRANAPRSCGIIDDERHLFAFGGHEIRIGARVVPGIRVAVPVAPVEVQELRLDGAE